MSENLGSVFNLAMDATKPPESQTPLLESEAVESSNCSHCLNGQEITINTMDVTALNLVLRNNRTTIVGNNSQLNICKRCLPRQRVSQSKSAESGVSVADGKGASSLIESTKSTKAKRRKRKRSSKVQTTSKCDVDGNFADVENSDSDNADKFKDFLQSDSDD